MTALAAYLLLGVFAGTAAGLLGIGGGLVIVPALAWLFAARGFADPVVMHLAVGTSLATIVATAASSVYAHHRRGAVRWATLATLTPGIVAGAIAGALIADLLPGATLRTVFGIFELLVAARLLAAWRPAPHRRLPGAAGLSAAGVGIGLTSAVLGIGGGTLTVPFLAWCNVTTRQAVATAAGAGLPIALAGAVGFAVTGWDEVGLPRGSTGYVYWPAVAGIIVASIAFAPLGARLAHALPVDTLRRVFGAFLLVVGIEMVLG